MNTPEWLKPDIYGAGSERAMSRQTGIMEAGWATVPSTDAPNRDIAQACLKQLGL